MNAKKWLHVATIASALAIAGTAVAHDRSQTTNEQAGAAVNSNSPAQLGTGLDANSAAQLGRDSSKATVPNDADAADNQSANGNTVIEQNPSTDTTKAAPARTGSDVRPGDMGPGNARGK